MNIEIIRSQCFLFNKALLNEDIFSRLHLIDIIFLADDNLRYTLILCPIVTFQ